MNLNVLNFTLILKVCTYIEEWLCRPNTKNSMKKSTLRRWLGTATFMLSVLLSPGVQAGNYTLSLLDSYGDGWNSNSIELKVDGLSTTYTLEDGYQLDVQITAEDPSAVLMNYIDAGSYQSEVSFELLDDNGNVIYSSGNAPMSGYHISSALPAFNAKKSVVNPITTFPYLQDFESGDGGFVAGGVSSSWQWGGPAGTVIAAANSGDSCWVTNLAGSYNNSENSTLTTPIFDFTSFTNAVQISFAILYETEGCCDEGYFELSVDGTTWHKVMPNALTTNWYNDLGNNWWDGTNNGWLTATASIDSLAGQSSVQFRFVFSSDGSVVREGFAIDDFQVTEAPCSYPSNLTATNISMTSADLVYSTVASNSNLVWGPAGFAINTGTFVYDANDTVSISGLTMATQYEFYVQDSCGVGNASVWVGPFSFRTHQMTVTSLPYFEGFEGGNGGFITYGTNPSWQFGTPTGTVINAAYAGTNAWVTNLAGSYNNSEMSYLTSPVFDMSSVMMGVELKFAMQYETEACCDETWVEVSLDGGVTWNKVTANGTEQNWYNDLSNDWWDGASTGWQMRSILISSVAGQSAVQFRFAFSSDGSVIREGVAIDNFEINELLCSYPDNLAITNIGKNSAEISWTSASSNPSIVEWGETGFVQGTGSFAHNTSSPTIMTGLLPGTAYDAYVRDSCGPAALGPWRGPITFYSAQDTLSTLPYVENFEATAGGWVSGGTNGTWEWGLPGGTVIYETIKGKKAWVTNLDGDHNPGESSWIRTPGFDLSAETQDIVVEFNIQHDLATSSDGAWLELSTDGTNWHKVIDNGSGVNWYNNTSSQWWNNVDSAWKTSRIILDSLDGMSFVQFRFMFSSNTFTQNEGVAIDFFNIDVLTCSVPSNDTVTNITSTSADIIYNSTASGSNVEYGVKGFIQGQGTFIANANDTIALTSLTPGTTYQYYIQDSCSAGNIGVWVGPFEFTTNQEVISTFPYSEGFETDNGGWIAGGTNSSWEWGVPAGTFISIAGQGSNSWVTNLDGSYNNSENSYIRSVIFDCSSFTNDLSYSFTMIYETEACCDEGYVEYSFDGTNWMRLVDNGTATAWYNDLGNQWWDGTDANWNYRTNVIPGSAGQSYVQIRHVFSSDGSVIREGFGVDDIFAEELTCPIPASLGATNIGTYDADIYWTSTGTQWNVEYGPAGFTPQTGMGTVTYVTNDTVNLASLTQNTCYDFYVQDSCLAGNSVWVGPFNFCTLPTCPAPSNLGTGDVTTTTAWLTWTGNNVPGNYQIEYGAGNFQFGTGTAMTSTADSLELTSLTAATEYCYYVREICSVGDTSAWSGPFCFATDCPAVIPGDDYASAIPATSFPYTYNGNTAFCYTNQVSLRSSQEVVFAYVPTAVATGVTVSLCGSTFDTYLYVQDDQFNTLGFNDDACGLQSEVTLTTSPSAISDTLYVVVEAFGTGQGAFTLNITEVVPCPVPTALTMGTQNCNSVQVSWTTTGAVDYQVEVGTTGYTPGSGTTSTTANTSTTINNLMPNSSYDVYVRANCGNGDTSSWAGPLTISTLNSVVPAISASHTIGAITATDATVDFSDAGTVADSVSWDFGDGSAVVYGSTPTHLYTSNNTYTVTATAITACSTDDTTFTVLIEGISVEENTIHAFDVFPNPTTGVITVQFDEVTGRNATLELADLQGRVLSREGVEFSTAGNSVQLDLSNLPKGVYLLRFNGENASQIERIVLK
ncbi:MAG: T9SS type A sorting domain-containing protein [Bacteroidetes bacterium]|nr:MAG: T9SS type A sorting domain-containing protein [Bacteroidota bacterium]